VRLLPKKSPFLEDKGGEKKDGEKSDNICQVEYDAQRAVFKEGRGGGNS